MKEKMIMKEYGGCLNFEFQTKNINDYWDKYRNNKIDVDSGRSALQYIIENYNINRIWLPVYNCPLVGKRIEKISKIDIIWYNIDSLFRPSIDLNDLHEGDAILWVNYCGVMPQTLIDEIAEWQKKTPAKVIIDNIPAYFSRPRMQVLNIYSCRKFIGVPDGGHIIGDSVKTKELPQYCTAENHLYLLKAIETGPNSAYSDYQESEKRFTEAQAAYGMPVLTKRILEGIDYREVIERRMKNFRVLHNILGITNRLKLDDATMTPSVYPYLSSSKSLREKLLENKIYVSRFWKHVLTNELANKFEKDLAEYLIPLPIDQRYDEQDMQYIANMVKKLEED